MEQNYNSTLCIRPDVARAVPKGSLPGQCRCRSLRVRQRYQLVRQRLGLPVPTLAHPDHAQARGEHDPLQPMLVHCCRAVSDAEAKGLCQRSKGADRPQQPAMVAKGDGSIPSVGQQSVGRVVARIVGDTRQPHMLRACASGERSSKFAELAYGMRASQRVHAAGVEKGDETGTLSENIPQRSLRTILRLDRQSSEPRQIRQCGGSSLRQGAAAAAIRCCRRWERNSTCQFIDCARDLAGGACAARPGWKIDQIDQPVVDAQSPVRRSQQRSSTRRRCAGLKQYDGRCRK